MSLHLVTGYKGSAHVTSADQGAFNASMYGAGEYVLESGNKFSAQVISNNLIRILDGDILMQGRHISLKHDTYEEVSISNGLQGLNRNDLIVARYTKDASTGVEDVAFVVIQGVSTDGTASDPEYTTGDILAGDMLHDMPLYRVVLTGLNVENVEPLFSTITSVELLKNASDAMEALLGDTDISAIGDGTVTGGLSAHDAKIGNVGGLNAKLFNKTSNDGFLSTISNVDDIPVGWMGYVQTAMGAKVEGMIFCYGMPNGSYIVQLNTSLYGGGTYIRYKQNTSGWQEWKKLSSEDDLAKYLPLAGGTVTGELKANSIYPTANNSGILGSTAFAWNNMYANNFTLQKSGHGAGSLYASGGTASATGYSRLALGNNKASGTDGNAYGFISLYGYGTGNTTLTPTHHSDGSVDIKLPKTSGTLMLKENLSYSDGVLTLKL